MKPWPWAVSACCGYEVVALHLRVRGRQLPTVSELAWRHPLLAAGLVAGMVKHFVVDNPYRKIAA